MNTINTAVTTFLNHILTGASVAKGDVTVISRDMADDQVITVEANGDWSGIRVNDSVLAVSILANADGLGLMFDVKPETITVINTLLDRVSKGLVVSHENGHPSVSNNGGGRVLLIKGEYYSLKDLNIMAR